MMSTELSLQAARRDISDLVEIGEGGFGKVFKAKHITHGTVAYKKMAVGFIKDTDSSVKAMQKEALVQSKLRHQNVIMLLAMVFEKENYGIVLEYAEYGDLKEFLTKFVNKVTWQFKVKIALDIAIGMCYLHTNSIIHGDLKMENILMCDGFKAKVSDFGLACWKEFTRSRSKNHQIGGTVTHISPERWKNMDEPPNPVHDIYGYGVLLWEISTELSPFANANPAMIHAYVRNGDRPSLEKVPKTFPETYVNVMTKSWSSSPDSRPQFCEIKNEFESLERSIQQEINDTKFQLHEQEKYLRCCQRTESMENNGGVVSCTDDLKRLGIKVIPPREGEPGADIAGAAVRALVESAGIDSSTVGGQAVSSSVSSDVGLVSLRSDPPIGVEWMDDENGPSLSSYGNVQIRPADVAVVERVDRPTPVTGIVASRSDPLASFGAAANDVSLPNSAVPGMSAIHRSDSEMSTTTDAVVHDNPSLIGSCQPRQYDRPGPSETAQILPSHQNLQYSNPMAIHRTSQFHPEHTSDVPPSNVNYTKTAPAAVLRAVSQQSADDRNTAPLSQPPEGSMFSANSCAPSSATSSHRTENRTYSLGEGIHINAGNGNEVYIINVAGGPSAGRIVVSGKGAGHGTSKHQAKPSPVAKSGVNPKKKIEIVVADKAVDTSTLQLVSGSIGKDWKALGRELRFEDSELDGLSYDFRHEGSRETAYQVLRNWHEKYGTDATLEVLAKALVRIKRGDLAKKLSKL